MPGPLARHEDSAGHFEAYLHAMRAAGQKTGRSTSQAARSFCAKVDRTAGPCCLSLASCRSSVRRVAPSSAAAASYRSLTLPSLPTSGSTRARRTSSLCASTSRCRVLSPASTTAGTVHRSSDRLSGRSSTTWSLPIKLVTLTVRSFPSAISRTVQPVSSATYHPPPSSHARPTQPDHAALQDRFSSVAEQLGVAVLTVPCRPRSCSSRVIRCPPSGLAWSSRRPVCGRASSARSWVA